MSYKNCSCRRGLIRGTTKVHIIGKTFALHCLLFDLNLIRLLTPRWLFRTEFRRVSAPQNGLFLRASTYWQHREWTSKNEIKNSIQDELGSHLWNKHKDKHKKLKLCSHTRRNTRKWKIRVRKVDCLLCSLLMLVSQMFTLVKQTK